MTGDRAIRWVAAVPRKLAARLRRPVKPPPTRATGDGTLLAFVLAMVTMVGATSFSGSYQHQYELDIFYRQAHWVAAEQPLSVDGLIVAAGLAIWYAARQKIVLLRAYAAMLTGIAVTVIFNLAADHRYDWPWLGPVISAWPAVALVAAYEMAVWIVRNRQERAGAGPGNSPADPSPAQTLVAVPTDAQNAAEMALRATLAAGNPLSGRQLETRFGLTRAEATNVRQLVLASSNGSGEPPPDE